MNQRTLFLAAIVAITSFGKSVYPIPSTEFVEHGDTDLTPSEAILQAVETPKRLLRGDWELPDFLMLAYHYEWEDSLRQMITLATNSTEVLLLVPEDETRDVINNWLTTNALVSPKLTLLTNTVDTPWVRDYGPLQVRDEKGRSIWLDAVYDPHRPNDDRIPAGVGRDVGARVEILPIYLEGGGIISNGQGLCVITEDSFESGAIDPFDFVLVDKLLNQLGCHVLALVPALVNEPTKHIDIFAHFFAVDHIAVAAVDPLESYYDAERLEESVEIILEAASLLGLNLKVSRVHMPVNNERYFTYLNGLRLRNGFMAPSYQRVAPKVQRKAYEDLQEALGNVPLLPIPADPMILQEGAIHCIAMGLDRDNIDLSQLGRPVLNTDLLLTNLDSIQSR